MDTCCFRPQCFSISAQTKITSKISQPNIKFQWVHKNFDSTLLKQTLMAKWLLATSFQFFPIPQQRNLFLKKIIQVYYSLLVSGLISQQPKILSRDQKDLMIPKCWWNETSLLKKIDAFCLILSYFFQHWKWNAFSLISP